jgi:hypothetical protein
VVFWAKHFEHFAVTTTEIASQHEFYSNDLTITHGTVLENTDYVILGAFLEEQDAPHLARVDLTDPSVYSAGSLGLGTGGKRNINNLEVMTNSKWVIMTEDQSRRVIVGDITDLSVQDQGQLLSLEGREKPKFVRTLEHFIDDGIFALASDDIKIYKVSGLEKIASKTIGVGSGIIAMQTWKESTDLAILLEDRVEISRLTATADSYELKTVVLEGIETNDVLNIVYDHNIHDILLVKVDGGHTLKFTPGDACHVNCASCTQSFASND